MAQWVGLRRLALSVPIGLALAAAGGAWLKGSHTGVWAAARQVQTCRLERVLDGDSLLLDCGGRTTEVRLHCIDAPERRQVPWGKAARRHLRELAPEVVELVQVDTDRFGRVVGDVYAPGPDRRWLNLEQVRDGQAAVYRRYCSDGRFLAAEAEARQARRGIWSRPGEQQTPWVFRHRESR